MNVVQLKSTSLLDYIIYSRIRHLEKLLGIPLYPHLFPDRIQGLEDIRDLLNDRQKYRNICELFKLSSIGYSNNITDFVHETFPTSIQQGIKANIEKPIDYGKISGYNDKISGDNDKISRDNAGELNACVSIHSPGEGPSVVLHHTTPETLIVPEEITGTGDKVEPESCVATGSRHVALTSEVKTITSKSSSHVGNDFERISLPHIQNSKTLKPSQRKQFKISSPTTRHNSLVDTQTNRLDSLQTATSPVSEKYRYFKHKALGKRYSVPIIPKTKEFVRPETSLKASSDLKVKSLGTIRRPKLVHMKFGNFNNDTRLFGQEIYGHGDSRATSASSHRQSSVKPFHQVKRNPSLPRPIVPRLKRRFKKQHMKSDDHTPEEVMSQYPKDISESKMTEIEITDNSSSYNLANAFDHSCDDSVENKECASALGVQSVTRAHSDSSFSICEHSKPEKRPIKFLASPRSLQILLDEIMIENTMNASAKKLSLESVKQTSNEKDEANSDESKLPAQTTDTVLSLRTQDKTLAELGESKSTGQQLSFSHSQLQQSVLNADRQKSLKAQQSKAIFAKSSMFGTHLSNLDSSMNGSRWAGSVDTSAASKKISEQLARSGITKSRHSTDASNESDCPKLERGLNARDLEHCKICGLGLWKMQHCKARFFNLTLLHSMFSDSIKNHPSTVTKVVESTTTFYSLIELIKLEQDIPTNTLQIYKDKSRSVSAVLPAKLSLEESGYVGSPDWYEPTDLTLYYDYEPESYDCPLLISDYYFINRKRLATKQKIQ